MNRIKILFLIIAVPTATWGQSGFTSSFSTDGQPTIRVESKLEPEKPWPPGGFNSGTASRNKIYQRYLYDKANHEYFGYSLALERVSGSEYRVTLGPLKLNPGELPIGDASAQLMPSPVFPPPQVVRLGDKVAIDFFENPKTGQKIVDYLWLERQNCDGESQKEDCLTSAVADADRELDRKLQTMQARQGAAGQQRLRQSQQSWEAYRDDACRSLADTTKQLECRLKLTRSRIHDLETLY